MTYRDGQFRRYGRTFQKMLDTLSKTCNTAQLEQVDFEMGIMCNLPSTIKVAGQASMSVES